MATDPRPTDLRYRTVDVGSTTWRLIDQGVGPAVLFCHGFPGLAFTWRHQVRALAAAGFRVIAPDMLGYGGTDRPVDVARYTWTSVADEVVALLDVIGVEDAVVVGHDFGAPTAWTLTRRHRSRVRGLLLMSMPYTPDRLPARPSEFWEAMSRRHFVHFHHLVAPGVGGRELDPDPGGFLRRLFHALSGRGDYLAVWAAPTEVDGRAQTYPEVLPAAPDLPWPWLSADEFAVFESAFTTTGFDAALNWYRAADLNWEQSADDDPVLDVPACFLDGENDPVATVAGRGAVERMRATMPGLRTVHTCDDAGHFIMAECADEVSAAVLDFVRGVS